MLSGCYQLFCCSCFVSCVFNSIHLSSSAYGDQGWGWAGPYPSCHWERGMLHPGQVVTPSQVFNLLLKFHKKEEIPGSASWILLRCTEKPDEHSSINAVAFSTVHCIFNIAKSVKLYYKSQLIKCVATHLSHHGCLGNMV